MTTVAAEPSAPVREVTALVLCARRRLDASTATRLRHVVGEGLDWGRLVPLARRHGLLPLFQRHLETTCPEGVPPEARDLLRRTARGIAEQNLALLAELFRVLDRLAEEGIAAVPLKGPAQAVALYGDLTLRDFTDLDILVAREDVMRARDVLAGSGYRPIHPVPLHAERAVLKTGNALALEGSDKDVCLELHWRPFPRHFRFPLEETGLMDRLETVVVQRRGLPQLGTADTLLFLAAHGFRHAWERLEWLSGLGELLRSRPDLDWDGALDRARALGGRRMLGLGLHLAASEIDAPVPPAVLRATVDREARELAVRVRRRWWSGESGPLPRVEETRFRLRGRERRRDRLQYLFQVVTTPSSADWRVARLGRGLSALYYGIRLVRLGSKYAVRAIRGARRGS